MARLAVGDKTGAVKELREAARLSPLDPNAPHAIGRILASQKQFDQAVLAFNDALKARSDYLPALIDRADVYAELEKNREAAADYEQILRAKPGDSVVSLKLGMIYQRMKRFDAAKAAYLSALRGNPGLALAYNNLAMIALTNGGKLLDALNWSRKAVELAPQVPQFNDTLGWIYRSLGDKAKAVTALEKAAKLPPPQADILLHLGQIYEETGRNEEALKSYRKALSVQADFPDAVKAKGRISALQQVSTPCLS